MWRAQAQFTWAGATGVARSLALGHGGGGQRPPVQPKMTRMVIGLLEISLHFPEAQSLKDKRQPLRSILTRVRKNHNVSMAEVAHHDEWQRATLAVVGVNTERVPLERTLDEIVREVEETPGVVCAGEQRQWL